MGFTALEIIVVLAVLVLLVALLLPSLTRPRNRHNRIGCVSNLKQVALAARMWANDNGDKFPWQVSTSTIGTMELIFGPNVAPHFLAMSNELNTPKILACGHDVKRSKAVFFSEFDDMHLSYFVGLDADETKPQSILSGDRNITGGMQVINTVFQFTSNGVVGFTKELHNEQGNIALGDGSVEQVSPAALRNRINATFLSSDHPTYRLAIP